MQNKFTIVLPVKNGGEYIKECINSILSQTVSNYNLAVLIHDCTDGTLEWLNALNDNRIVIYYAENIDGIAGNWNRIKDISKNEFMTIIGYDDILYTNFLEQINLLINKYPNAALYHTHFHFINSAGKIIRKSKKMKDEYDDEMFLKSFLQGQFESMGSGYVMRSSEYDRLGGIPLFYNLLFADFALWLSLIQKKQIVISPETCFAFRLHQSVTSRSQAEEMDKGFKMFLSFLKKFVEKSPELTLILNTYGPRFLSTYIKSFSHRLLRTKFKDRKNVRLTSFISARKIEYATLLGIDPISYPEPELSVKLALLLDSNIFFRYIYHHLRKLIGRPFLK